MSAPSELGGTETYIADLVLTSKLTTSNFGDRRLFFRHQNMADDVILKPEWDPYLDKITTSVQTCPGLTLLPGNNRVRHKFCLSNDNSLCFYYVKWDPYLDKIT